MAGAREPAAVRRLIASAREALPREFGPSAPDFDSVCWDVRAWCDRQISHSNPRVYFTRWGTTEDPLPDSFASVVKSWLILAPGSAKHLASRLDAARMLWEAVQSRRKKDSSGFQWSSLCTEDLSQTENFMRETLAPNTVYKRIVLLIVLTRFLSARHICRPLCYTPQSPRVEDWNRHTIAGQQARRDRLPTEAALAGLADIYREHATEPPDRLRICAIALLVVSGLRIGELLTLPLDCEVEETRRGELRFGLRYYREKSRGGEKLFAVRWLTSTGAELARKAIAEIRAITQLPRERARVLEASPERVPIPGYHWAAKMTAEQVAAALSMSEPPRGMPFHRANGETLYRVFEVERFLLTRRVAFLWTLNRRDGSFQMLSETLFVVPRSFFHAQRPTCSLLVEPVLIVQISDFLSGRPSTAGSAFERFGIHEPNGAACVVTSHQFRHWLNYIADKGGLPVDVQTRWLGRQNPRDTEAYRHATTDERLDWVKAGLRDGEVVGKKAEALFELPRTQRDIFLDTEIQAVHVTAFGLCLHDFAVTPCPYHLNCVRGCSDYVRTKGNAQERSHLVQIQVATEQALQAARALGPVVAEPWIRHCEETLAGVRRALMVDEQAPGEDGIAIKPFAQSRTRS